MKSYCRQNFSSKRYKDNSRLFIGNLHQSITSKKLYDIFCAYGKIIEDINLKNGFAFIQYETQEDAIKAIQERNESLLGHKNIRVEFANATKPKDFILKKRKRNESFTKRKRSKTEQADEICNIPIFIPDDSLITYAQYVKSMLFELGNINSMVYKIVGNDYTAVYNQRYMLCLFSRNVEKLTISFCAKNVNGIGLGFFDTPVQDVARYITSDIQKIKILLNSQIK